MFSSPRAPRVRNDPAARQSLLFAAVGATLAFAVDRSTKVWAVSTLDDRVIELPFRITLALLYNNGVAFGMASSFAPILLVIALFALLAYFRGVRAELSRTAAVAMGLMIGGAVSNAFDRFSSAHPGAVVDFIDVGWWPVFNFADVAVVTGAILLGVWSWRRRGNGED